MRAFALLLLPFMLGCASLQAAWRGEPAEVAHWESRVRGLTIIALGNDPHRAENVLRVLEEEPSTNLGLLLPLLREAFDYSSLPPQRQAAVDGLAVLTEGEIRALSPTSTDPSEVERKIGVVLGWIRSQAQQTLLDLGEVPR